MKGMKTKSNDIIKWIRKYNLVNYWLLDLSRKSGFRVWQVFQRLFPQHYVSGLDPMLVQEIKPPPQNKKESTSTALLSRSPSKSLAKHITLKRYTRRPRSSQVAWSFWPKKKTRLPTRKSFQSLRQANYMTKCPGRTINSATRNLFFSEGLLILFYRADFFLFWNLLVNELILTQNMRKKSKHWKKFLMSQIGIFSWFIILNW